MCRKHRRCPSTKASKAAAAKRARSYRARRRDATSNASNQPTSDQETAVPKVPADRQPAGGDVTHPGEQPAATSKPKHASKPGKREKLTKSQKIMKQVHANLEAEYGKPMTATEQAAAEEAATKAQQAQDDHNATQAATQRAENEQALREHHDPAQESGVRRGRQAGPVNVVGDGNITIAGGAGVIRAKRATSPRTGRRIVEDHTSDTPVSATGSEKDRVWTVSPSPVPTTRTRGGRDANPGTTRGSHGSHGSVTQDDAGNLTITGARGPLHITRTGRDGKPELVGDVTPARTPRARVGSDQRQPQRSTTSATRQQSGQRVPREGDVTRRGDEDRGQRDHGTSETTTGRGTVNVVGDGNITVAGTRHRGGSGEAVNVVGDGNITVANAGPAAVRVGNYAAPSANVGVQTTGHVHGANVTIHSGIVHTGTGDVTGDHSRARDIARTVADRVRRATADMAEAMGDVTHHDDTGHTIRSTGVQGIQAPHIHNSRVVRDHD